MTKKTVTLEQILSSLKKAIVQIKGGINDETLSVDTLSDDKEIADFKGGIDVLDVVEMVMLVEKDLNISIDDKKATDKCLYEEKTLRTLTVKGLAEIIVSLM